VFLSPLAASGRLSLTLAGEHDADDRLCAAALQHAARWDTLHSRLEGFARLRPCIFDIAIAIAIAVAIVRYREAASITKLWRTRHYHHIPADVIITIVSG